MIVFNLFDDFIYIHFMTSRLWIMTLLDELYFDLALYLDHVHQIDP